MVRIYWKENVTNKELTPVQLEDACLPSISSIKINSNNLKYDGSRNAYTVLKHLCTLWFCWSAHTKELLSLLHLIIHIIFDAITCLHVGPSWTTWIVRPKSMPPLAPTAKDVSLVVRKKNRKTKEIGYYIFENLESLIKHNKLHGELPVFLIIRLMFCDFEKFTK